MWAGIHAVQPVNLLPRYIQLSGQRLHICGQNIQLDTIGRIKVIAVGKAAAAMALEVEKILGDRISEGICITKYEHGLPLKHFDLAEAAHPIPDENSVLAGERVLNVLTGLNAHDIVLVLISGGASALMVDRPAGCTLPELQHCFELLVNSGADIHEINTVRKHLSHIKGGQLALMAKPAKLFSLIISDVVGDDISSIASGPTAPDETSFAEARAILEKYACWDKLATSMRDHIEKGEEGHITETVKPGDEVFKNVFNKIIGNNGIALDAAKTKSEELGYHANIVANNLTGEANKKAIDLVKMISGYNGPYPGCLLMGGETTLQVTGSGKGGRNQHFILCATGYLLDHPINDKDFLLLSAGTDGTDGPTDANGAIMNAATINSDRLEKNDVIRSLKEFDSYPFFENLSLLIKTGPTQTNVMDIMIALIDKKK